MIAFILLIVILGILIFVHELGHFLTAKNRGAYVYEFALGMGPKIFSFKRKNKNDPTVYSLRLFPIGGFCAIAGEVDENDGMDVKLEKKDYMCNKKIWERCLILIAGVTMNFLTGILILFISALIWGATEQKSFVGLVAEDSPIEKAGIEVGDRIISINGKKTGTWDEVILALNLKVKDENYEFSVKKENGDIKNYTITPLIERDYEGKIVKKTFGVGQVAERRNGFVNAIKYAFEKTGSILSSMGMIISSLVTGKLSLNALSGPIGVYSVVGEAANTSVESVLYLMAYLSLNLGFINILPFPAFDGGRVLFLLIEAIRKKKMNPKIENGINAIGFALLMLLMIIISIKDILNLF